MASLTITVPVKIEALGPSWFPIKCWRVSVDGVRYGYMLGTAIRGRVITAEMWAK